MKNRSLTLFGALLVAALTLPPQTTAAEAETAMPGQAVVATLAGEPIRIRDIHDYVERFPQLRAHLSMPGGPNRVLDYILSDRLLRLEGERRGIPEPADGDEVGYTIALERQLVGDCSPPSEDEARAYFERHGEQFASPLRLRLQRIGLRARGDQVDARAETLNEWKRQLEAGERDFAKLADEHSEDPLGRGRGGDIGYTSMDPGNPLFELFDQAKPEQIIGPVQEENALYLYRVTGRQEPIPEQFESVAGEIAARVRAACRQHKLQRLLAELQQRWPVVILDPDIGVRPETR